MIDHVTTQNVCQRCGGKGTFRVIVNGKAGFSEYDCPDCKRKNELSDEQAENLLAKLKVPVDPLQETLDAIQGLLDVQNGPPLLRRKDKDAWEAAMANAKDVLGKSKNEQTISLRGIWLLREGDDVVVLAWMPDGTYREVIREDIDGPFSHCVHAGGIRRATTERKYLPGGA